MIHRSRWRFWALLLGLTVAISCGPVVPVEKLQEEQNLAGLMAIVADAAVEPKHRVRAAMSLVRMKPLRGRPMGIGALTHTLRWLSESERAVIVPGLVGDIAQGLRDAPEGEETAGTYALKDTGYLLLSDDLVADPALRAQLIRALAAWAEADFKARNDWPEQLYGMNALYGVLGAEAAANLAALIDEKTVELISTIIGRYGDSAGKDRAGEKLVELARSVATPEWRAAREAKVVEANRRAGLDPTPSQLAEQLRGYQDEMFLRVLAAAQRVGGTAVIDYCLQLAGSDGPAIKWRQAAVAALEGHIAGSDDSVLDRLQSLGASYVPAGVADQVFRRIAEAPRARVAGRLLVLFATDDWRRRRRAALTWLEMAKLEHLDSFMSALGGTDVRNFNLAEAIAYGAAFLELAGGDVQAALATYHAEGPVPVRLSALAAFFTAGTAAGLPQLKPYELDPQRIPKCAPDAICEWTCSPGGVTKPIATVGDFVRHCLEPEMERR